MITHRIPVGRQLITAALALALVTLDWYLFASFHSSSVCTRCGMIRRTSEWQIPFTRITWLKTFWTRSTPVNAALTGMHLVPPHEHHWSFIYGAGNGISCAVGDGTHIAANVESSEVASLLLAADQYGAPPLRDHLIEILFDPRASAALGSVRNSTNRFHDKLQFARWAETEMEFLNWMAESYRIR